MTRIGDSDRISNPPLRPSRPVQALAWHGHHQRGLASAPGRPSPSDAHDCSSADVQQGPTSLLATPSAISTARANRGQRRPRLVPLRLRALILILRSKGRIPWNLSRLIRGAILMARPTRALTRLLGYAPLAPLLPMAKLTHPLEDQSHNCFLLINLI